MRGWRKVAAISVTMAGETIRRKCRSRQASSTLAGAPSLTSKLEMKTLVSRTTRSTAGPHGGGRFGHLPFHLLGRAVRSLRADPVHDFEARLPLGDQSFVHLDRDQGHHRCSG